MLSLNSPPVTKITACALRSGSGAVLPPPGLPPVSLERIVELVPSAVVIAFLAGVESLLSAMVADRMVDGRHRPNAELLAQGTANVASALFAGLPATGAIAVVSAERESEVWRTPRGRALATEGYRHLGLQAPKNMAQLELIEENPDAETIDG